jgi:hypothetical protein
MAHDNTTVADQCGTVLVRAEDRTDAPYFVLSDSFAFLVVVLTT